MKCVTDGLSAVARGLTVVSPLGIEPRQRASEARVRIRRNGDVWSPCQESNLDDRLRRPVLGLHRDRERCGVPRGIRPELYGVREVDGVQ